MTVPIGLSEQPTIGGLVSNFTYNEYPLRVIFIDNDEMVFVN